MKKLIFTFIFTTITSIAFAQLEVRYIAFFPTPSVTHQNVTVQPNSSGRTYTPTHYLNNPSMTAQQIVDDTGSLILGASNNADITIKNLPSGISSFGVEGNMLISPQVTSNSASLSTSFTNITAGNNSDETSTISTIYAPEIVITNTTLNVVPNRSISVQKYASVVGIQIRGKTIPIDGCLLPNKLYWKRFRIKDTQVCAPYLVCGEGIATKDTDECSAP